MSNKKYLDNHCHFVHFLYFFILYLCMYCDFFYPEFYFSNVLFLVSTVSNYFYFKFSKTAYFKLNEKYYKKNISFFPYKKHVFTFLLELLQNIFIVISSFERINYFHLFSTRKNYVQTMRVNYALYENLWCFNFNCFKKT